MSDAAEAPPPRQLGVYDLVRKLGSGGMGVVYEARHREIGRRVAIKLLSPEHAQDADSLRRFFNEARAVNLIEHPSLVQISDYGQGDGGAPYLVMEFLSGQTLRRRIDELLAQGRLPTLRQVMSIGQQVADALAAAHSKGVIHRDLKPENLMLVADPVAPAGERVKILDFGIAKVQSVGGKKTTTGTVIGTPLYMSPEQCSGADETTDRSDVYSLGVILYELLSGRPPFDAEGAGRIIAQHLFHAPPDIAERVAGVPVEIGAFVRALLHKEKQQRPSMSEVLATLSGYLRRLPAATLDASLRPIANARTPESSPDEVQLVNDEHRAATTRRSRQQAARVWLPAGLGLLALLSCVAVLSLRRPAVPTQTQRTGALPGSGMEHSVGALTPPATRPAQAVTRVDGGVPGVPGVRLDAAPVRAGSGQSASGPGSKPSPAKAKPTTYKAAPAKSIDYEP